MRKRKYTDRIAENKPNLQIHFSIQYKSQIPLAIKPTIDLIITNDEEKKGHKRIWYSTVQSKQTTAASQLKVAHTTTSNSFCKQTKKKKPL